MTGAPVVEAVRAEPRPLRIVKRHMFVAAVVLKTMSLAFLPSSLQLAITAD